tara:strand:- start:1054 stop:1326 length:273 start_codon:yes stop_codon:yes gene_type:complete
MNNIQLCITTLHNSVNNKNNFATSNENYIINNLIQHYLNNNTKKDLCEILKFYNIKLKKMNKYELAETICVFETNFENNDIVLDRYRFLI